MIVIKGRKDIQRLRRIALCAQGLHKDNPFGRGLSGALKAINHIGYVQLDTISVVERAHHHVFYSRVGNFHPSMTNQLLKKQQIFEYWSHAAALLPISDYRFSLPYKHAIKSGQIHWNKNPDQALMADMLVRIKADGPLRSRDVESESTKGAGWWDWKPAKKALEQLYMQGDIMVADREGFQKTYDLTERVLPPHTNTRMPSIVEFAEHLVEQQMRCHGFVSIRGITYLRRNSALRKAVNNLVQEKIGQGDCDLIQLPSGDEFVVPKGAFDQPMPRLTRRLFILSPFDNCVIQRQRLKAVFEFDYQIECYVPQHKRRHGYFCLPLLYRGEFIGRMDCKAERKQRNLVIKSLYFENDHFPQDEIIDAFVDAMRRFKTFQQCESVSLENVNPKVIREPLKKALAVFG